MRRISKLASVVEMEGSLVKRSFLSRVFFWNALRMGQSWMTGIDGWNDGCSCIACAFFFLGVLLDTLEFDMLCTIYVSCAGAMRFFSPVCLYLSVCLSELDWFNLEHFIFYTLSI